MSTQAPRRFQPSLTAFDALLTDGRSRGVEGWRRGALEFLWFGIKEARACLFAGMVFTAVLLVPRAGVFGVPRYDLLLVAALVAALIYLNFFTHHALGDARWYLAAIALGLYAGTTVAFRPLDRERGIPLLLGFVLIGFFVWLAENVSTFWGLWRYPNQLGTWSAVHVSKWSSWSLLVIMTFTIVANLKHIKARIHVPD
ncbi:DUF817 family protein [Massilia sp. TW-1]|uniref:DUF817 family protein n=1 Tax=Telluria antibiotica TaxID=2717319 RepID=A0ABX0PAM3_9BURK|nr:DUF817 family protein [Telluria antibiotica]NIA54368.1 DUF817 family protein [Telluria antibiotica]